MWDWSHVSSTQELAFQSSLQLSVALLMQGVQNSIHHATIVSQPPWEKKKTIRSKKRPGSEVKLITTCVQLFAENDETPFLFTWRSTPCAPAFYTSYMLPLRKHFSMFAFCLLAVYEAAPFYFGGHETNSPGIDVPCSRVDRGGWEDALSGRDDESFLGLCTPSWWKMPRVGQERRLFPKTAILPGLVLRTTGGCYMLIVLPSAQARQLEEKQNWSQGKLWNGIRRQ